MIPSMHLFPLSIFILIALLAPLPLAAASPAPVQLAENGAWCWFQDERAIIDGDRVFVASVKSPEGDIDIHQWDLETGEVQSHTLAEKFLSDDHAVPALLVRPDGRLLVAWSGHGAEPIHWTISREPGDIGSWTRTRTLDPGARTTYNNLFRLAEEGGRIYNFHRGIGFNPNYLVSDDDAESFRYGGRLFAWPKPDQDAGGTGIDGGRPYLTYASDHRSRIHFTATDDHPRAFDNSIYHGYIEDGKIHHSDGTVEAPLSRTRESTTQPSDLTTVFAGDGDNVAWNIDLELDASGNPIALFSIQKDAGAYRGLRAHPDDGQDHRYGYARWDGAAWQVHAIAYAGTRLYPGEDDYTGLGAIDPNDPTTVVISTDAHPVSGAPLISAADGQRRHELFVGRTPDGGASWTWRALTRDSKADNLRPIIPAGQGKAAVVLWLRGDYRSYTDYRLEVLGMRLP